MKNIVRDRLGQPINVGDLVVVPDNSEDNGPIIIFVTKKENDIFEQELFLGVVEKVKSNTVKVRFYYGTKNENELEILMDPTNTQECIDVGRYTPNTIIKINRTMINKNLSDPGKLDPPASNNTFNENLI
jgi:hypothetical protein